MLANMKWLAVLFLCAFATLADAAAAQNADQPRALPAVTRELEMRLSGLGIGAKGLDPEKAIADLSVLLAEAEGRDRRMEQLVIRTFRAGHQGRLQRFAEAIKDLDAAIAIDAGYPFPLQLRGVYRAANGDREGGIADLDKALALAPQFVPARVARSTLLSEARLYVQASEDLAELVRTFPQNREMRYRYALSLSLTGRKAEALAELDRAADGIPVSRELLRERAIVLAGLARFDEALAAAGQAIELGDDDGVSHAARARVQFWRGAFAEAESDSVVAFDRGLAKGLPGAYVAIVLEAARLRAGRSNPADLARRQELAFAPEWSNHVAAFLRRAITAEQLLGKAVEETSGLTRDERLSEAQFYIGQAHLGRGDKAAARVAFQAVIALNVTWFFEYGWSLTELERLGQI